MYQSKSMIQFLVLGHSNRCLCWKILKQLQQTRIAWIPFHGDCRYHNNLNRITLYNHFYICQARGHVVAQLDPLGIMFKDHTTTISDRIGSPPDQIIRQHSLGTTPNCPVKKLTFTKKMGRKQFETWSDHIYACFCR